MIIGIGADLCNIERIAATLERFGERFTQRVFTEVERRRSDRRAAGTGSRGKDPGSSNDFAGGYSPRAASYAKRFAAKEACAKALGTGMRMGTAWREMGVVNLPTGQPTLELTGKAAARLASLIPEGSAPVIHLTITDDAPFAQAFVVIEARPVGKLAP